MASDARFSHQRRASNSSSSRKRTHPRLSGPEDPVGHARHPAGIGGAPEPDSGAQSQDPACRVGVGHHGIVDVDDGLRLAGGPAGEVEERRIVAAHGHVRERLVARGPARRRNPPRPRAAGAGRSWRPGGRARPPPGRTRGAGVGHAALQPCHDRGVAWSPARALFPGPAGGRPGRARRRRTGPWVRRRRAASRGARPPARGSAPRGSRPCRPGRCRRGRVRWRSGSPPGPGPRTCMNRRARSGGASAARSGCGRRSARGGSGSIR